MKPEEIEIVERGLLIELNQYANKVEPPVVRVGEAPVSVCRKLRCLIVKGSIPKINDIYSELIKGRDNLTDIVEVSKFELTPELYSTDGHFTPSRGIMVHYQIFKEEKKKKSDNFNIERYG